GDPHSQNPSSRLTHDTLERVRYRILQHFNTTPEEYSVIFTSGCTAALKAVADSFPWRSPSDNEAGSCFSYLTDNHTSVVGIRGKTLSQGVVMLPVSPQSVEDRAKDKAQHNVDMCQTPHLFCYPAQSNFSGWKYPLNYVKGLKMELSRSWISSLLTMRLMLCTESQVNRMASLYNIHLRTGCFCNTGACQYFLGITNQQMKRNVQAGHVCGDNIDMVDGQPTGSVRVSFGYMSTFEDCQKFLNFVVECFVEKPVTVNHLKLDKLRTATVPCCHITAHPIKITNREEEEVDEKEKPSDASLKGCEHGNAYTLTNIYIYPIKSCAAFEVYNWPVGPKGLLYDRGWMVVNKNGVCLSQKRESRLCLVQPQVHLSSNKLLLQASGMDSISVPLKNTADMHSSYEVCQSQVCGDRVETVDCGDEAALWFSEFLGQPCRLIRQNPNFSRDMEKRSSGAATTTSLSLVNEAQYLLINHASVQLIQELLSSRFKHPKSLLKTYQESVSVFTIYFVICEKVACKFHIPFFRQENSVGDQHLDTKNIISRFRANLVIAGVEAFEEDNWSQLMIGNTRFVVTSRCGRCHVVGVDQETGTKTKEPLLSLSSYRTGKVTFGVYLKHDLPPTSMAVLSTDSLVQPELNGS
ncbi:unnamed protein product, partial [Tetraodon nigroviridis]